MGRETKAIKDNAKLKRLQAYLKQYNKMAYVYVVILITTGYRASDIISLTVLDIKEAIKNREFKIIESKNANLKRYKLKKNHGDDFEEEKFNKVLKARAVPIGDSLIKILSNWIDGKDDFEYIFKSPKGAKHFSVRRMGVIINEAAKKCDIDYCVANHGLRKTYGYITYKKLCEKTDPIYALLIVQKNFMHASPEITKRYIGLEEEDSKEIAEFFDSLIAI
ncbi:tyrosine-type recombinase/integrase [Clostridium chrysemydis]|uniref:tyrosine-type recombinase/integrase n=1 Tax=Clostridium chrysemydis TaxID=2665504 RepID=UPI001883AF73|nr:tyrosine-type recombinase/integrase [Clostridium chrysemydis]